MNRHELVCIVCPMGCRMTLIEDPTSDKGWKVAGNNCKRGIEYGIKEMTEPTRVLTTTVVVRGGLLPRLPVRTQGAVPKELVFKCMDVLDEVVVDSPVQMGQVIVENILNTGIDVIATRSMQGR